MGERGECATEFRDNEKGIVSGEIREWRHRIEEKETKVLVTEERDS